MSSSRSSSKTEDKYSTEKLSVEKHTPNSQRHGTERSRHGRRKSTPSRNRNLSRDHLGNFEERSNMSEDRRDAYWNDDDNRERQKKDNSRSYHPSHENRDNQSKGTERNRGRSADEISIHRDVYDDRLAYKEIKSSSNDHRLIASFHNDNQNDLKLAHNDRYNERRTAESRSRSPKIDYTYNYSEARSTQITDNRQNITYRNSFIKMSDFHNSNEGKHHSDKPSYYGKPSEYHQVSYHFSEKDNHDRYGKYNDDSLMKGKESCKTSDERHISFKNPSGSGEDEFVASLLQKIDFLSNQNCYSMLQVKKKTLFLWEELAKTMPTCPCKRISTSQLLI